MPWTHLGGGISAWGGRCNERLFPLVSLFSTYATVRHRPPPWTTKLSTRDTKKEIQIHTLKYGNAVERKHNLRLNKFRSADDGDASLSSSISCRDTRIPSALDFPTLLLQIQDIIVLKSTFLANVFVFFLGFSGTNRLNETRLTPEQMSVWWQLTQKPYLIYIFFFASVCRCGSVHHLPVITGKEGFMTNKGLQLLCLYMLAVMTHWFGAENL